MGEKSGNSVREIFLEAAEIDSPEPRAAYLDKACAGDESLRRRVEVLLAAEAQAGGPPFDTRALLASGLDAMRQTIREKEPPRPSTRLHTLRGEELTTAARSRGTEVPRLVHLIRGDLDWIVMKCLEKDRKRRYETANGLAMDLGRHLNNEPVVARPPSRFYEFQKTVRRHKVGFAATAAIMVALAAGVTLATWQAVRAKRAEAMALQSRGQAEKLSDFMLEDFYNQLEPSGRFEIIARLTRKAVDYYDHLPASLRTPETERNRAMAQARLALITAKQADYTNALQMASQALDRFKRLREKGDQSEEVIFGTGLALFAEADSYNGPAEIHPQRAALQRGAELLKPLATSPNGSRRVKLLYAEFLRFFGYFHPAGKGIQFCEEALRVLAGLGATNSPDPDLTAASVYADIANSEASGLAATGRMNDADRLLKRAQTLAETVLARRPDDLRAMKALAFAERELSEVATGRFQETNALRLNSAARQAAEKYVRFNPSDSNGWKLLAIVKMLGAHILFHLGNVSNALQEIRAAKESGPDLAGPNHLNAEFRGFLSCPIASWEAQWGDRPAAEQAVRDARLSFRAYDRSHKVQHWLRDYEEAYVEAAAREVKMEFGENSDAYTMARSAADRLKKLGRNVFGMPANYPPEILYLRHAAWEDSAQAALNLRHYVEAAAAARALLLLPASDNPPAATAIRERIGRAWAQVLLAQAEVGQGHKEEALKTVEGAVVRYRQRQAQGESDVVFRQRFARSLYVQSLAEPADAGGLARRRHELNKAGQLLQGLSDQARQLHDSREMLSRIAAAEKSEDNAAQPLQTKAP